MAPTKSLKQMKKRQKQLKEKQKQLKKRQVLLKESLTQLKWSYKAVQFGRILMKTKKCMENLKGIKNLESTKLAREVFDIMQSESKYASGFIAHIMWEVLNRNVEEALPYSIKADIADMIKPYEEDKYKESEVNIELLLNRIERIVSSFTFIVSSIGSLPLSNFLNGLIRHCCFEVKKCLIVVYENRMKLKFAKEEKLEVGELISEVIYPIKLYIARSYHSSASDMSRPLPKVKAAMQFLIGEYGKFPTRNKSVAQVLDDLNINESMKILDILITRDFELQDLHNETYFT